MYQFQVYAASLAGLGPASKHSADLKCEAWNMPEPGDHLTADSLTNSEPKKKNPVSFIIPFNISPLGPAYDLTLTEVRNESVVVEWQKPVYTGSGPITGYHVEFSKTGCSEWITANESAVSHRFYKVKELFKRSSRVSVCLLNVTGTIISAFFFFFYPF